LPSDPEFLLLAIVRLSNKLNQRKPDCGHRSGLEQSTATFAVLSLAYAGCTSLLNLQSKMFSTLWLSELFFSFHKLPDIHFSSTFLQISQNFRIINGYSTKQER